MSNRRLIGPLGTAARVLVGGALLGLALVAPDWWGNGVQLRDALLALGGFAGVLLLGFVAGQLSPGQPLRATGELGSCISIAVAAALFAVPLTKDAATLFYGGSMLLAAARGSVGCEVSAFSNWLLLRDDQVGCMVFGPVDDLEERLSRRRAERA